LTIDEVDFTLQFEPHTTHFIARDEFDLSHFPGKDLSTSMPDGPFGSLQTFASGSGVAGKFYSLPQLEKSGVGPISRLPIRLPWQNRIESLI